MTHDQQMTALRILCVNTHDVTGDVISAYLRLAREVAESASLEADWYFPSWTKVVFRRWWSDGPNACHRTLKKFTPVQSRGSGGWVWQCWFKFTQATSVLDCVSALLYWYLLAAINLSINALKPPVFGRRTRNTEHASMYFDSFIEQEFPQVILLRILFYRLRLVPNWLFENSMFASASILSGGTCNNMSFAAAALVMRFTVAFALRPLLLVECIQRSTIDLLIFEALCIHYTKRLD